MTKLTLNNIENLENQASVVSDLKLNNALISNAIENTLSRDGTEPNSMEADLDMNSNRILNLPTPISDTEPLRLGDLTDLTKTDILVQTEEPSVSHADGSLWIDSDSTDLDLYQLSSSVWTDTGVNLKGDPGAQGPAGSGDLTGPGTTVTDGQVVIFAGTTGNVVGPDTTSGILKGVSGVLTQAVDGSDYISSLAADTTPQLGGDLDLNGHTITGLTVDNSVADRTALASVDGTTSPAIFLRESGREGVFKWSSSNLSTQVTNDPGQGVYVPPASDATGASGCWVRVVPNKQFNASWFGATTTGDTTTAVQRALDYLDYIAGGTLIIDSFYKTSGGLTVDGNDINIVGAHTSCGFYTDVAGIQLLKLNGVSRCKLDGLLLNYPVFTSTNTDFTLWIYNCVQCRIRNCKIQGGYYPCILSGGACADVELMSCVFLYSTGVAQLKAADSTGGVCGAFHIYDCKFNQPYATAVPNGTNNFKGVRANSTAYSLNDVVSVGSYYLQCQTAGTSGGSAPTVNVWYGTNITDGTVTWRLMSNSSLSAIDLDTNVYYIWVNECDMTGPYQQAFRVRNSFAGTAPSNIVCTNCTAHGPISIGAYIEAGNQIDIERFDSWNPTNEDATTYGVLTASAADDVNVRDCKLFGWDNGIFVAAAHMGVTNNTVTACATGIRVAANTLDFRIIGNNAGYTSKWGANTNSIVVDAGTSDRYQITANNVNAIAVSDGGTGANKAVGSNY